MDFLLPEDITALTESVARFAATEIFPVMPEFEKTGEFPHVIVQKMAAAGCFGAAFPEAVEGSDAGFLAVSAISETISRLAPEFGYCMNMQAMTCPFTIFNWGTGDQISRFVPDLIAGKKIGMFALSEPGGGSDAAGSMKTTAVRDGDVYRLNGSKQWITFANEADTGILFAKTDPAGGIGALPPSSCNRKSLRVSPLTRSR
jgi:alkylation response protein AidB-like acyl-CoA dehydrogenase